MFNDTLSIKMLREYGDGTLPEFIDGGYTLLYFDKDNCTLCVECANKTGDAKSVVVFYSGAPERCEECNCEIYGSDSEDSNWYPEDELWPNEGDAE